MKHEKKQRKSRQRRQSLSGSYKIYQLNFKLNEGECQGCQ